MKVAVITALWYEDKFLSKLFKSLEVVDYPISDWEIVMIDNRNSEITRRWIETNVKPKIGKTLPQFTLLPAGNDTGFAAGNNACMERAIERGAKAVYLLNEDAHGDAMFLRRAVERLEADKDIAAVQSLILLDSPEGGVNSIGNCLHFLGFSYCDGYKMPRHDALGYLRVKTLVDPKQKIASASGAAVLFRAEALAVTGLFDESYHLYHEDLDLSLRLREAGYSLVVEPSSIVFHQYEFGRSTEKYYWMEKNRYRLIFEHYQLWTIIVLLPALIFSEIGLIVFGISSGTLGARFKVYGYIFDPRNWGEILEKRERVQRLRRRGDKEILQTAVSSIGYQETKMPAMRIFNALMAAYWAVAKHLIF